MFISVLKNHLGYDDDSMILKQVKRIPLVEIRHRREHNPLGSVHDLIALGNRINTSGRWNRRVVDYKSWIYFMVFSGMRPTEFERGLWERDKKTGHLRIKGTKTVNAVRVIPNMMWLKPEVRRLASLQMRLINLDPPTDVRCRDFRRTAAIWWEKSGVQRSRYSYYLGHGAKDITGLYERRVPTEDELNEDRKRLLNWVETQRATPRVATKRVWSAKAEDFITQLESP
jgi:integrase